jgi:tRNA(Ile)-lysidine synthetase-like protein
VALPRAGVARLGDIAGYALRPALVDLLGDAREFGRTHYRLMTEAAAARTGSSFPLPRGVVLTVDAEALLLALAPLGPAPMPAGREVPVPGGPTRLGTWAVEVIAGASDGAGPCAPGWDEAAVVTPPDAVLRAPGPGDRVALGGGRKKLADAYIDAKAPRRERAAAPVLAAGAEVLWTPLLSAARVRRAADGARVIVRWRRAGGTP